MVLQPAARQGEKQGRTQNHPARPPPPLSHQCMHCAAVIKSTLPSARPLASAGACSYRMLGRGCAAAICEALLS